MFCSYHTFALVFFPASLDLQVDSSSLEEILEETEWEVGSEGSVSGADHLAKGKATEQAEKEIRLEYVHSNRA